MLRPRVIEGFNRPKPSQDRPQLANEYVAPHSDVEKRIAETWASVLEIDRVGLNDNFFELGGHSLLAIQVISLLRDALQLHVPLQSLWNAPSVFELSALVEQLRIEGAEYTPMPELASDDANRYEKFPLTDIQQAYWAGRNKVFDLGSAAAHHYMRFEARGLDLDRLNAALQKLIDRHDLLRAIIHDDGQQQILKTVPPYRIHVKDLRSFDEQEALAKMEEDRSELSHQVFEPDQWPLFEIRANLLKEERSVLHVSIDMLIADADSLDLLIRELGLLYLNTEAVLPKLDITFRDYVIGEISFRQSKRYQESQSYWMERLKTLPPAPEMQVIQGVGSPDETPAYVRYRDALEATKWKKIKDRAARAGVTPSGVLLAAYSAVLRRWAKKLHFTINVITHNRLSLHSQVQDLVGDFTSLTLLSVNSNQPNFEELAKSVQKQLIDDLDHRYVSGIHIMREQARMQGNPFGSLLPVAFTSLLPLHARDPYGENPIPAELKEAITQRPQLLIDHQISEEEGVLQFHWDVLEQVLPAGYLREMFGAYRRLLHLLAEDEEAWLEPTLQLLPESDVLLQQEVNATEADVSHELLQRRFVEQVALRPHQKAVIASERTLTYEELFRRSNQLGRKLRAHGARPNRLIAIVMEKGWEQAVATVGILQSGAAYLPIDPTVPQERLDYLLESGEAEIVLTQAKCQDRFVWPSGVQVFTVADDELASYDDQPLTPVQGPDDLAYVIFTSGSTGQPKGVVICHHGAVQNVLDVNERFNVQAEDKIFALSPINFDLSVYDLFGTFAVGGTLVFPDAEGVKEPAHWAEVMKREGVTVWNSSPPLMERLVDFADGRADVLPESLRLVLLSGDWIAVKMPDRLRQLVPAVEVISMGGATEASIWSILYRIGEIDEKWTSIPYGKPMKNQRFYVLNELLEPCPTLAPGQLYIGGIGLAKGYWKDPAKTNASFIVHPLTGERLYRTGDNGRYLPDGNIEFMGREDSLVKVQGIRIELGEIEVALSQHEAVRNAVVHAVGSKRGNKRLIGYVVLNHPVEDLTETFQNYLQQRLPAYMIPSLFMTIDAVPLSPNGKVNRNLLPEPNFHSAGEAGQDASLTHTENRLAEVWKQALNVDSLDPRDNFYHLGGDSVLFIRLISKINKEFRVEIAPRVFFADPTVAHLARHIDEIKQKLAN
ncbi:MAG: amino acid adenylation domain-containing protein [Tumebacillaceae bacterium]